MDETIRQEGSIPDYINFAKTLMADDEFKSMEEHRKVEALANYRDAYLDTRNFERPRDVDGVRRLTNTYANLVKQGRLTPTVEDTQQLNIKLPDLSSLSVDAAMERLTEARQQVEDAIPNTFDPVYHEDYKFAYDQWFNEQERSIRGRNTGRLGDLGARFFQGAASRVMTTIGMDTDEFSAKYFAENPDYDDSWWSDLAQGGGDMAATVAVTLAGSLLAGPAGGAAAGLYTNGIGKYTEAYKTTFDATGNHLMAHDAGVGALPGAVLETVGDSMLVGRMTKSIPKSVKEELRGASSLADKRAIVAKHLKDVSFQRNVTRGILEQSATEAVTEVSGSYASGLGATLASGFEQVPTAGELAREGSLALVLGGAAGAVGGAVETGTTRAQLNTISQGIIGPDSIIGPKFKASSYSEPKVTKHTDGTESISVINDQQQPQIITPENRDLYNHLRNLLSARAPIDDISTRPPGRQAGGANNINTNMERLAVTETVDSLNQELNALLPARNQLFSQLDSLGLPPEQVELVKTLQDTVTLNLIKNGGDPSAAYGVQATSESVSNTQFRKLSRQFARFEHMVEGLPPEDHEAIASKIFTNTDQTQPDWFSRLQNTYARERDFRKSNRLYQYAGRRANLPSWELEALETAEQMLDEGVDAETIRLATNWFPNPNDGKLRLEIPDYRSRFTEDAADTLNHVDIRDKSNASNWPVLSEVFDHPELYARYPQLENLPIIMDSNDTSYYIDGRGSSAKHINIRSLDRSDLLHEIAHAIQDIEGFPRGASPKHPDVVIEAEDRAQLTPEQLDRFTELQDRLTVFRMTEHKDALLNELTSTDRLGELSYPDWSNRLDELRAALNADERTNSQDKIIHQAHLSTNWRHVAKLDPEVDWQRELLQLRAASSPDYFRAYQSVAGEIEARDVEARANLTSQQLAETPPLSSQNIPQEDVIVLYDNDIAQNVEEAELQDIIQRSELPALPENSSELFQDVDYTPGYKSREVVIDLPIDTFLGLARGIQPTDLKLSEVNGEIVSSEANVSALLEIIQDGGKFDSLPYLSVNESSGRIIGHEGRHRAMALKALGYETMPVTWSSSRIRWSEQQSPDKIDYIEDWPTQITNEDGTAVYDYPVGRDGSTNQTFGRLSQTRGEANRQAINEQLADLETDPQPPVNAPPLAQPTQTQEQGAIEFNAPLEATITEQVPDMQAVIRIFQDGGNVTTLIHEMFHWWHRSGIIAQVLPTEQLVAFEQAAKVEDGVWTVDNYELAARTFEGWLRNPGQNGRINVSPLLQKAFQRLAGFFRDIYRSLRNSPLPWSEVRGRARPNIDPGFRSAFETLFQIGDPMAEGPAQEGQRLPQVNVGYQGDPSLVSGQQGATETQPTPTDEGGSTTDEGGRDTDEGGSTTDEGGRATEGTTEAPVNNAASNNAAAATTETQPELYEKDDRDKLNIRLIEQTKSRGSSVDAKVIKLFKDIIKLNTGLKQDTKQSGLFWAALDSYVRARKLVPENREEGDYQLITASPKVWTDAEYYDQQGRKIKYKQPFEQGYVSQLADLLTQIKADATTRAEAEYRKNNEKFLEEAPEGMSLFEMQKWVSDKRKEEQSSDETPERRKSIEDETLQLQAKLRTLDVEDLISELGARQNEEVVREYLTFLSDLDVTNQNLSDGQALELQIQLDQIVNNGTLLGLKQLARAKAESALGSLGNQRYRDAFSKWGLGNFLNQTIGYGDAFNDFIRRLSLAPVNFERIAGNDQAKQALRNMFANYQHLIGEKQRAENRWSEFLQATKKKWWPKLDVNFAQAMHRAGIASKIMQAPSEESQEGKDAFVRQNVAELRKGFQHMIDFGGSKAQSGRLAMNMLDELLVGLDQDTMTQHEFIEQFAKQHPQENGYINDMIEWVEENLKQDAIFISEALYETEFHEFDLYLPTRQNPVDESRYDTTNLDLGDSAMLNNMGDGGFGVMNPVTVDRSQSLKLRKGYVKDGFAFATNLENTLDTSVKALLNDIYTGLERQKLSYLFNQNSNLRPQLEAALGSGTRATHLAQTIRDVVSSDLNHHNPINGIELAVNKLKRNLGPGYMSSLHQFISQPISQFVMHLNRRGAMKTLPLYKEAMKLLTTVDHESELYQSWLLMKDSHLSTRALPQDPHLVKGKQHHDNAFERLGESFLERLGVENTQIHQALNNLKVWDDKFKQSVLLGPLRVGDLFSADLIFAAELINKAKQTQGNDLHKLDLTKVSPEEVLESLDVMDESINASRNSRRGALLAHPGAIISLLTVFSGHRLAMATNTGLKFRNLMEMGFSGDAMVEDSVRTLIGTTTQAMAFTAVKAMVVGTIARAAYLMLTPDEDEERHWLYGDLEKQEIQALRKMRDDGLNQTFGQDAFWKATLKDASGNLFWNLSFFGMENFWFGRLDDVVKPNFKQGKEELVKELKARLQTDFDSMTDAQRQDIANQIKVVESTKYVPYSFRNFDEVQLGGAYGLTLEPILEGAELLTDMVVEGPDSSDPIDFLLLGRLLGYSQQDINRFLRTHSKNLKKLNDLREDDELVDEETFSDFGF